MSEIIHLLLVKVCHFKSAHKGLSSEAIVHEMLLPGWCLVQECRKSASTLRIKETSWEVLAKLFVGKCR